MNDFIRNPATSIKASHTIRELGYYINTIKIEYLSLVCTLTTRLSTSAILRFVSSLKFKGEHGPSKPSFRKGPSTYSPLLVACCGFEPPRRRYERPMQPITPSRNM
jgi:hypothetical protein